MFERMASSIARQLFVFPGGYYIVQFLKSIFGKTHSAKTWEIITFRKIKIRIDLSKQMGNAIYWRGAHDWAPIFVLEKNLHSGDTFIDIGANQGEYALWAARKIGNEGLLVAYEPSEEIFDQLEENIKLNQTSTPTVRLRKIGLSDKPGFLKLYTKKGKNEGVNTVFPTKDHDLEIGKIELTTLDMEVEKLKIQQISLIKIDVEGAELNVLKGSKNTLSNYKPKLLVEINRQSCLSAGYDSTEIITFLESFHYELFVIGLRGKLSKLNKKSLPEFCNLLAIPTTLSE